MSSSAAAAGKKRSPARTETPEPLARARQRAAVTNPGTVLFREPGAEPVASFPVPEVPSRGKRGMR